jgi:hypothetical protein
MCCISLSLPSLNFIFMRFVFSFPSPSLLSGSLGSIFGFGLSSGSIVDDSTSKASPSHSGSAK